MGDGQGPEGVDQRGGSVQRLEDRVQLNAGGQPGQMSPSGVPGEAEPVQIQAVCSAVVLQPPEAGKDVLDLPPEVHLGEQAVAHAHDGPPLGGQVHTVGPVQLPVAVHPASTVDVHHHGQRALRPQGAVQVQRVHRVAAGQIRQALQDLHSCGEGLEGQPDSVPPAVGLPLPADQGVGQVSHNRLLSG